MTELLAVDAGGTSTRAIVLTADGQCRGFGVSGSGNPISSCPEHVAQQVATAVRRAMDEAGIDRIETTTVLAMAGSRTHAPTDWIAPELAAAGVHGALVFESDLLATFCAGAWELDGYALVAGTGSAAIRVRDGRQEAVADGIGWLLGDAGSGFWIGRRVARAVAAQLDGRGPTTALTEVLLASLGISTAGVERAAPGRSDALRALLDAVYGTRPIELARFAPLVFAVGDDRVAEDIRTEARAALRASLASIEDETVRGPLVCGGGVLGALEVDVDGLTAITEVRTVADGTVGAAVLALRADGRPVERAVFERIRTTVAALRN